MCALLGDADGRLLWARRSVGENATDPRAWLFLAETELARGADGDARAAFERAAALAGEDDALVASFRARYAARLEDRR